MRNKTDQHVSTGCLQVFGLIIRGRVMLSHEGLPLEREILEYTWQMEIILGKISARLITIQLEKTLDFVTNFYLQIMEDEYTLARSPYIDKIAPIRLCVCNMHTSLCNESLTLKVGTIQIRQLLRLYPGSWLEMGSISIPELHEQFFKSTFRLSEQSSFGRLSSYPELHVLHSHLIFEHVNRFHDELDDEEIFYLFDFCEQQKKSNEQHQNINDNPLRCSVPTDLYSLSRANSLRNLKHKSVTE
ncbi:unnamed protein product [Adineta steineri]|uniref:Uncharacterized protein n=1 Tax=Adineta steineri TaxID=433720 RepID=A0A814WZW1_9BILA|nr:unnamed protein product [Adineta steineri]CAF4117303.1 unnamed protein product [Adineta steineri]